MAAASLLAGSLLVQSRIHALGGFFIPARTTDGATHASLERPGVGSGIVGGVLTAPSLGLPLSLSLALLALLLLLTIAGVRRLASPTVAVLLATLSLGLLPELLPLTGVLLLLRLRLTSLALLMWLVATLALPLLPGALIALLRRLLVLPWLLPFRSGLLWVGPTPPAPVSAPLRPVSPLLLFVVVLVLIVQVNLLLSRHRGILAITTGGRP